MSTAYNILIIAGTIGTLVWLCWFLFSNRTRAFAATEEGTPTTGHVSDGIEEYDNPLPQWWVGLFFATIVFGALYLAYYPGLGTFDGFGHWSSSGQWQREVDQAEARFAPLYARYAAMDPQALAASREAMNMGRRLFANSCSVCHGATGRGGSGFPDLTDSEWAWGGSFQRIQQTILDGRTGVMPPWQQVLGDAGVADVANYVLSLSGANHDAAAAARGEKQYQTLCVVCHGPTGTGNPMLGAPDLANGIWRYGGTLEDVEAVISKGRTGQMPPQRDLLGEPKVHILAAYVMSLGTTEPRAEAR